MSKTGDKHIFDSYLIHDKLSHYIYIRVQIKYCKAYPKYFRAKRVKGLAGEFY